MLTSPWSSANRISGPENRWNWGETATLCGNIWDWSWPSWMASTPELHTGPKANTERCVDVCWRDGKRAVTVSLIFSTCSLLPVQPLSAFAVQFLNGVGDLLDLVPALTPRSNSSTVAGTFRMPGMGHCTALIKVRLSSFGSSCEGAIEKHHP